MTNGVLKIHLIPIFLFFLTTSVFGKDVYVSTLGNDRNPGTKEKPFASIKKAQENVRKMSGPIVVYLRGGTYYLKETMVFTPADSRKPGAEVIYKTYPGEKVIISGAVPLRLNWENYKGKIVRAKVKDEVLFDQLFINGEQQHMARYPNYDPKIRFYGGYAADAISPERVKSWKNPEGGFIHALHKHEWGGYQYLINGIDEKGQLKLEGGYQNNRQMGMHDQYRFVENIFEELDTVGEWYFNKAEKMLYYYPRQNEVLKLARIEVPQLKQLFEFKGTVADPVRNIQIEGLELTHTLRTFMETREPLLRSDWAIYRGGAVFMEGAENCRITNCFLNTVGGNGVFFSNYNRNNVVSGCRIANAGASGVCFVGDPKAVRSPSFEYNQFVPFSEMDTVSGPKTNNYPAQCSVENTLMYGLGQVEKQVAGVEISMSMDITVSHNTIYDVPRSGINIGDGTWGGHVIAYNDVFNTVLETGDHGAFNSWGRDRFWHPNYEVMTALTKKYPALIIADVVKTIRIHHNRFRCDHGWDIDLDDGSSNYHIYNNVCLNGGLKLREGFYRKVENNIILNNSFHPHVWFENSLDIFRHNIVTRNYFPIQIKNWGKGIDFNLFPDQASLDLAQKTGTDKHSLFGKPGFINPTIGDYRVKTNSKALTVGFRNFPMNDFGVQSPALRKLAKKVPLPKLEYLMDMTENNQVIEWFGLQIKNLETLGERSATGMSSETGVLVLKVSPESPYVGKIKGNDVLLSYQQEDVKSVSDLLNAQKKAIGQKIKLTIFRNQKMQIIEIESASPKSQ